MATLRGQVDHRHKEWNLMPISAVKGPTPRILGGGRQQEGS